MQGSYPNNEPKHVINTDRLLKALRKVNMTVEALFYTLDLTFAQKVSFFRCEPRVARLLRLRKLLAMDNVLDLLDPVSKRQATE